MLLFILFFAYGTTGTYLFRETDPAHFGTLDRSMLTLFGILTLEGWVEVMQGVQVAHPGAWAYFISFILLGTFIALNLFVGVIVNNVQKAEEEEEAKTREAMDAAVRRVEAKLDELLRR